MRSFKGILAMVLGVVLLIPVVSHAMTITIDGVNASTKGFSCGTGTRSCAVPIGQYGNYDLGGTPVLSSSDGSITDTLKFTGFTIRPHSTTFTSGDVIITYSQAYISGTAGTYSFGDYMGGYFSPTSPIQTNDSITMNGSGVANTTTNLATLSALITSSNFFSKSSPILNPLCSTAIEGSNCSETLSQTIKIHFIGRDAINATNSFFTGHLCQQTGEECSPDDAALQALFQAEQAADIASFCDTGARGLDLAKCVANLNSEFGLTTATPPHPESLFALTSSDSVTLVNPEPSTWLLLGTGLGALALWKRKRPLAVADRRLRERLE